MTRRRLTLALGLLAAALVALLWRGTAHRRGPARAAAALRSRTSPPRAPSPPAPRSIPRFVSSAPPPLFPRFFLPPHDAYDTEVRDEAWALAMENALRTWMAPEALRQVGLGRLEIVDLSCRRTACRLEYEYPSSLLELVTRRGLPPDESPLVLVMEQQGPAAPRSSRRSEQTFVRDGEPYRRVSIMLGFDEESIDPARHGIWSHDRAASMQLTIEKMRVAWGKKRPEWERKHPERQRRSGADAG